MKISRKIHEKFMQKKTDYQDGEMEAIWKSWVVQSRTRKRVIKIKMNPYIGLKMNNCHVMEKEF